MNKHPASDLFPLLKGSAFDQFVDDIRNHGQQTPISMLPDGRILDGRNRFRACKKLGVKPNIEVVDPESPVAFVLSANMHRRHLTKSQLGCLAAEVEPMFAAEAKERQRRSGGGKGRAGGDLRRKNGGNKSITTVRGKAARQAATAVGAGQSYTQLAKRVKREEPATFEKLKRGDLSMQQIRRPKTSKRKQQRQRVAEERASNWLATIDVLPDFCSAVGSKLNVIKLRRESWISSCKSAVRSLRILIKQLEGIQ